MGGGGVRVREKNGVEREKGGEERPGERRAGERVRIDKQTDGQTDSQYFVQVLNSCLR